MEERKIMDGVYFTDYRDSKRPTKPTCGPTGSLPDFVTLDRVEAIESEEELRYVWSEVFKRWTWLQVSTSELFEFHDVWEFIQENVAVIKKYKLMIEVMETKIREYGIEPMDEKDLKEQKESYEKILQKYDAMQQLFHGAEEPKATQMDEGVFV